MPFLLRRGPVAATRVKSFSIDSCYRLYVVLYTQAMGWFGLADQLAAVACSSDGRRPHVRSSSRRSPGGLSQVAERVLEHLSRVQDQQRQQDIRVALGISHPAAVWALIILRREGKVEVEPDVRRHPRYLLYRSKAEAEQRG